MCVCVCKVLVEVFNWAYSIIIYSVFQVEEGVVLVCTSNHCCIHIKWVSFSGGYLYKQGQLPFL